MKNTNLHQDDLTSTTTDSEVQKRIYATLRKIEMSQDKAVSKLSTIAGIAVFCLISSLFVLTYLAFK